jgi:hypothetical protein
MPPRTRTTKARRARPEGKAKRPAIVVEDLLDFNESMNLMILGDSGVGKTPFAGQAPNAVFVAAEKGTISAKRFGSTAKLIRAYTWIKLEAAIDYLEQNPDGFDWMILDSLPKLQTLLLRHLLETNVEENKAKADLDLPALADHQKWQNMFKRFVDRICDLGINVIFIATTMRVEIDDGGDEVRDVVLPAIQGKPKEGYQIAQYVCAQMDSIYVLQVKSDKETGAPIWRLLTRARPPYIAKDRYNAHRPVVVRPNMAKIIEAINNSVEAGTASESKRKSRAAVTVEEPEDDESAAEPSRRRTGTRRPARAERTASGQLRAVKDRSRSRTAKKEAEPDEFDPDEIELEEE